MLIYFISSKVKYTNFQRWLVLSSKKSIQVKVSFNSFHFIKISKSINISMTPEAYSKFKEDLKKTQQMLSSTISRIDNTMSGVKETISHIQQNDQKIQDFKQRFNNTIQKLAVQLAGQLGNPLKKVAGQQYEHLPVQISVKEVVNKMMKHKEILIMTGAGVSKDSGIPTYRGENGIDNKKFLFEGKQYEPEQIITNEFFQKHPQFYWNRFQTLFKLVQGVKPNKNHILIDKLATLLSQRGIKVTLVTQNIDDLHLKPNNNEYQYHCVHGNVKYLRCNQNHLHQYADYRKQIVQDKKIPHCIKCGEKLRPHVLFFDESYGPLYGGQVKDKDFPFIFSIGTSLSTGLCTKFAIRAKQIVEINPNPVIEVGQVYQFTKNPVEILQSFLKETVGHK